MWLSLEPPSLYTPQLFFEENTAAPPTACWPRPGPAQRPDSGGTVFPRHRPAAFPSAHRCLRPCNGFRAGKAGAAGASLPPGPGRPRSRPAGSGSEDLPCRRPLPKGAGAVAPAPEPAAARAPVGAASGRVRVAVADPGPPAGLPAAGRGGGR